MRTRLTVLACVPALLLAAGLLAPSATGRPHHQRPRIKGGHYIDGDRDVYLDVDVRSRSVLFHFTLYCNDLFADQWVSTGPKPTRGELTGNRRGAKVFAYGEYEGPPAVGPGTSQVADWTLNGKFTGPAHFEGSVEYEAATFPEPTARPQCLDAKKVSLDRAPPG